MVEKWSRNQFHAVLQGVLTLSAGAHYVMEAFVKVQNQFQRDCAELTENGLRVVANCPVAFQAEEFVQF